MFGFGTIMKIVSSGLSLWNKLFQSREEKAGRAMAERDQLKESADARKKMDAVPAADERDTVERLRDGNF